MPASVKATTAEFVSNTKIGEKGQLTIPKPFRDELGIGAGAAFAVLRVGDGPILLPEHQRFAQLCERITSALTHVGVKPQELLATLPQARERVYTRHYGALTSKGNGRRRPGKRVASLTGS
jgi:AbrB family looped-hinge helix DNA binding protein